MIQMPDLSQAEVGAEELNPFAFNPDDYPDKSEMINFIMRRKEIVQVHPMDLAVNGTVVNDDMSVYLKHSGISSGAVKEAIKSPLHYWFYMNQEFPQKPKKHFELGTFAHMAFLEPALFSSCLVEESFEMNTTQGVNDAVDWWKGVWRKSLRGGEISLVEANLTSQGIDLTNIKGKRLLVNALRDQSGYRIVDEEHKTIINVLQKNYLTYGGGIIPQIMRGAIPELSMYGRDPETGLEVKIRPDAIALKENIGVDAIISFKTARSSSVGKFMYDAAALNYHISEGMYQEVASTVTGRKFNTTIMIMLQTTPPYLPAVFWWTPEDLAISKHNYHQTMSVIKEAHDKGVFPGFDALAGPGDYGIIDTQLPSFAQKMVAPVYLEDGDQEE